jgi:hypothetical protein
MATDLLQSEWGSLRFFGREMAYGDAVAQFSRGFPIRDLLL